MCKINWNDSGVKIFNLIRGLSPSPGAFTEIVMPNGEKLILKIVRANFVKCQHESTNGYVSTDNKNFIAVYCRDGVLEIKELQLQGKKRMHTEEFLRGFKITFNRFDPDFCS